MTCAKICPSLASEISVFGIFALQTKWFTSRLWHRQAHLFKKQNIEKRRKKHWLKVLQLIANDKSGRSLQKSICRRPHNTKLHNHNVWLTQFVSTRLGCNNSHADQCLLRPHTTPWLFFLAKLLGARGRYCRPGGENLVISNWSLKLLLIGC